jgi:arylformamidase
MFPDFEIIDISQPVLEETACFPGDTPFQREITVSYPESQVINLTAFTMSPHVGTHADAPIHIQGEMAQGEGMIGQAALKPYLGPAVVVDVSPVTGGIPLESVQAPLEAYSVFPSRILFKTAQHIRYNVFEAEYAYFSLPLVAYLSQNKVVLMGIDTPSVDPVDSKTLDTHHAMLAGGMAWLENLDLTQVEPGEYFLAAQPLKMMTLEASPVRAVLLKPKA